MVAHRATVVSCMFCGKEIGDHDPLVVIEHDGERETSLAREPDLRELEHVLLVHAGCAHRPTRS
ncbi:MAG TPA: hypothetical protein VGL78_15760 [Solirubrobacteraceae bacterium]|jgi:hypothetical protein